MVKNIIDAHISELQYKGAVQGNKILLKDLYENIYKLWLRKV